MIVFWAITPFQNALFARSLIHTTEMVPLSEAYELMPFRQQSNVSSVDFFYTAYNTAWGGLQPVPFTSSSAAYTAAVPSLQPRGSNATWRYNATQFSANLECITPFENETSFYDETGCWLDKPIYVDSDSCTMNTAYFTSFAGSIGDAFTLSRNCTMNGKSKYVVFGAHSNPNRTITSTTALFCTPVYYSQGVTVEVNGRGTILFSDMTSQLHKLESNIFDFDAFEELVVLQTKSGPYPQENFPTSSGPAMPPNRIVDVCSDGAAGFALPFGPANYADFLNSEVLYRSFNAAYQLLFATAFNSLSIRPANPRLLHGESSTWQEAITVVKTFMILLECSLAAIAILGTILLILNRSHPSNLRGDPSSISHLMALTTESSKLLQSSRYQSGKSLVIPTDRLSLQGWTTGAPYRLDILLSNSVVSTRRMQRVHATGQFSKLVRMDSPLESSIVLCCGWLFFQIAILSFGISLWYYGLANFGM